MKRLLLALLLPALAMAQVPPCASGPEMTQRIRERGDWSRAYAKHRLGKGAPVREADGLYIVPADVTNAPYLHPVDLAGKTIVLERRDATTFRASIAPLDFQDIPGAERVANTPYTLPFDFPFFDGTVRTLTISSQHALYPIVPPATSIDQRNDADLATSGVAVIAPFLSTADILGDRTPRVFVRELSDSVTITWTIANVSEIQAVLSRNGDIRFSYRTLTLPGGAVLVTSGREAWRGERTRLASLTDLTNETPTAMADITGMTVERISDLDLYEIRLRLRVPIVPSQLPSRVTYNVSFNGQAGVALRVDPGAAPRASYAAWGTHDGTTAVHIDGDSVVFTVPQTELDAYAPSVLMRGSTFVTNGVSDFTTGIASVDVGSPRRFDTDFSALETPVDLSGPIAEAFTLPAISIDRVWEQLEEGTALRGDSVDGVAIYQNFLTDIVFYAGAFASGGNAGVAGIIDDDTVGLAVQRQPNVMHMNAIGYGWNRSAKESSFIILHEFGHLFAFYPWMMEDGRRAQVVNPDGGHPAQWVDMRAAFNVYSDHDASVMGGGAFTDNGNGTFTASDFSSWGYSWLDLYLMGLASPEEVPPFFYIADSNPPLGESYFPPANAFVRGTRHNVDVQQFVEAMGPRSPAYPETQRKFRTIFVILEDPAHPVSGSDLNAMATYRAQFEMNFRIATGRRAEMSTRFDPSPPRRRSLR